MLNLNIPVEKLPYGSRIAARLKKIGIKTARDLLWHFPFRYEDLSRQTKIADIAESGQTVSVQGRVAEIKTTPTWRRRTTVTDAVINDGTGLIHAIWFNQPYLETTLAPGSHVSISGKTASDKKGLYLSNPAYEKIVAGKKPIHTAGLVPVYPETEGVSSKYLRFLIKIILDQNPKLDDPLPKTLLEKYRYPPAALALRNIHFPKSFDEAQKTRKRFAFEEILLFQLQALRERRQLQILKAPRISFDKKLIGDFVRSLPFKLTADQRIAAYEILKDLERGYPMNRLLNGDVGSGKTVVALIAAYQTACAGYQTAFMAPTEILAQQHYQTITSLIPNSQFLIQTPHSKFQTPKIGLLTGSEARQFPGDVTTQERISKKLLHQKIASGEINLVIGTHAVIQKDVKFKNLGLAVIDEQHRFGVEQRMRLVKNQELRSPHLLSMTATPIPRTLALTIYGDLDVSLLKEKPRGRQEIITKVISHRQREETHRFIDREIEKGRQVFVICPRIEAPADRSSQPSLNKLLWSEVKAVTEEYDKLSQNIFPHRRVAMLHGKMKSKEKEEVMKKFKAGHYDILVSTSVVEVGVDVANATVMMIESADRFGLAQLHQFRGRVGRGRDLSHCLLFSDANPVLGLTRLKALERTNNGFELAELDLKLRGPGEFIGTKQSGLPDLAMASLSDLDLIKKARLEAKLLMKADPGLKSHPALLNRLSEMQRLVHFE